MNIEIVKQLWKTFQKLTPSDLGIVNCSYRYTFSYFRFTLAFSFYTDTEHAFHAAWHSYNDCTLHAVYLHACTTHCTL